MSEDIFTSEEHFSYYAFDGRTVRDCQISISLSTWPNVHAPPLVQGALRWKHEASDFYDEGDTDYSDQIGEGRAMHLGEVSWNDFRHSVMQQLPHKWFQREVLGLMCYFLYPMPSCLTSCL